MSVSNLCSSLGPCQTPYRDDSRQPRGDGRAPAGALRATPLTAAWPALDTVRQAGSSAETQAQSTDDPQTTGQSGGALSQLARDLSALGDALRTGDRTAAQQAFATMQQDLHTVRQGWGGWALGRLHHRHHHGHHHHRFGGMADGDNAGSAANSTPTAPDATGTADGGSGSLPAARQTTGRTSITAVSVSVSIDILTVQATAA